MRRILAFASIAALTSLNGCSPEGFDVAACSLSGKLAFRIQEIDGLFRNYQPRPSHVAVLAEGYGPGSKWPGVWTATLKNYGEHNGQYENRPARKLIVYGQVLPGWEVEQRAKALERRKAYWFTAEDNGHRGATRFVPGQPLKPC